MQTAGLIIIAIISYILTGVIHRYALAKSLIDIPNERSSHSVPTPRGGGLAIVLVFLSALLLITSSHQFAIEPVIALSGAGGLVALVGFLDDHGHLAVHWRLLAHFIAAGWGLAWLGGMPPVAIAGFTVDLAWFGNIVAAVCLVWLLNLYNFMDGIDGIAGVEGITVCIAGALLYVLSPVNYNPYIALLLIASITGFLFWNFPKAKIFMGDAGSGFIGITLGLMSIQAGWIAPELLWGWLILLGAFIVDASITLIRRMLRGEKIHQAHRSHAYQYASRQYNSHVVVTLAFAVINLCWLLPLAALVVTGKLNAAAGIVIAYMPLIWLATRYNAGVQTTA